MLTVLKDPTIRHTMPDEVNIDSRAICQEYGQRKSWFPVYKGPAADDSYHIWVIRYHDDDVDDDNYDEVIKKRREILRYWGEKRKREEEGCRMLMDILKSKIQEKKPLKFVILKELSS